MSFLLDGARTALVGENGVGKSTLLKCLVGRAGARPRDSWSSRGACASARWRRRRPTGLDGLSVRHVLGRSLAKIGAGDEDWRIDVLLDEIGLAPAMAEESSARFPAAGSG